VTTSPTCDPSILDSLLASPDEGPITTGERAIAEALETDPPPVALMAISPIRAVAAYDPWARVVAWGRGMTELLGWEPGEVLGLVAPSVSSAVRPWFEWLLAATLDTGEISTTLLPLRSRTEETLIARITAVRLDGLPGSGPHVLVGATPLRSG